MISLGYFIPQRHPSLPHRRIEIASVGMRAEAAAPALGKFN
jgi:hypothetical protein